MQPLRFSKSGKFRILILADIQEIALTNPDTVAFIKASIEAAKPDLIVLTGDQIKGYGVTMTFGDVKKKYEKTLKNILSPIRDSGIPFTAVFGNHDESKKASKPWQWEIYKKYGALGDDKSELPGCPNFMLPVLSSEGDITKLCLWFFDSSRIYKGRQYRFVSGKQLDYYKSVRDDYYERYGEYVPAMAFQHIPANEVLRLMREVPKGTKGSFRGNYVCRDKYFVLGDNTEEGGFMGENAAIFAYNSGEFDTFKEKGDMLSVFFGHDHNNSFIGDAGGVKLCYTQGCGFNCYGPGLSRGARVIDIDEGDVRNFKTSVITYKDLFGRKLSRPLTAFLYSHSPSSVDTAIPFFAKRIGAIAAVSVAATVTSKIIKWQKLK